MSLRLYNSLPRQLEDFKPIEPGKAKVYSCGPTVYAYPTVGNWRTFVFDDLLRRVLAYLDYEVIQVMNLTDVGHMTMDEAQKALAGKVEITDSETGVDRMEKAARKEGKSVWEVAQYYIDDFQKGLSALNILTPHHMPRATDFIEQQIKMIAQLEANGFVYQTAQAVYYDVQKFENYGALSGQKIGDKWVGVREDVNVDPDKRHPADFRLWQFADDDRAMLWDSPWGKGFPGWHIECSAMSVHYLGAPFDIHTGGIDHIPVHHENEIAQTEAALGTTMANVWMHGEFLQVDGGRMGKSLGNAWTLQDIEDKAIQPLALRYYYLNAHYRSKQNFTWEALSAAEQSLSRMREAVAKLQPTGFEGQPNLGYQQKFTHALEDDLNLPQALSVAWEALRNNLLPPEERYATLLDFDRVLGLNLDQGPLTQTTELSQEDQDVIKSLIQAREQARADKDWTKADTLRDRLKNDYNVTLEDSPDGTKWVVG